MPTAESDIQAGIIALRRKRSSQFHQRWGASFTRQIKYLYVLIPADPRRSFHAEAVREGAYGSLNSTVWPSRNYTEPYGKISDLGPRKSQ